MTDDEILTGILNREGSYVNIPADKGGPTNRGITQASLAAWRGHPVTAQDVRELQEPEVRAIYRARYIMPFNDVPAHLREHVIDIGVNSGVGTARVLLKRALAQTKRSPATHLVVERLMFYAHRVKTMPTQSIFIEGWVARACSFLQ